MQQKIGQDCGPFGKCKERECRLWRPVLLDEVDATGKIVGSREEWDCALAWPMFHQHDIAKRVRGVKAELEAFRQGVTEAAPTSPLGIIALAFSSIAQSVAQTIDVQRKGLWQRLRDRKLIK